jgi:hypothetical protein
VETTFAGHALGSKQQKLNWSRLHLRFNTRSGSHGGKQIDKYTLSAFIVAGKEMDVNFLLSWPPELLR